MSIQKDDPRLTSFALGELTDPAFEAELAKDADAMAEVEAIRAMAVRVDAEFKSERPAAALTDAQRTAVTAAVKPRRSLWWIGLPLAACVVAGVVIGLQQEKEQTKEASRPVGKTGLAKVDLNTRTREQSFSGPKPEPKPDATVGMEVRELDGLVDGVAVTPNGPPVTALPVDIPGAVKLPNHKVGFLGNVAADSKKSLRLEELRRTVSEEHFNREAYDRIRENPFERVADEHTSTFSIDVDTASYANVRRFLRSGRLPPPDAVRIEELINYFTYDYAGPASDGPHPFRAHVEIAACPWNVRHRLARIAIKGKEIQVKERPPTNLVFLVDVSGSMRSNDKLPLLKEGLKLLVEQLDEGDRVAIVVYAGAAGMVLPSTTGFEKELIKQSLTRLTAGGSTNGGAGIQLAYDTAKKHFIKDGVNRVILCTDGDFNVGISGQGALVRLIEERAKTGVFLSVLGFGTGNYQDARMEALSNNGNGNYAYIDSMKEARKVLVDQMSGTLVTIAKDVKIQVFFNPKRVAGYRLIGYENRMLAKKDFNDDTKDAGEIGAGHSVTALYELVLAGSELPGPKVDPNPFVETEKAKKSPIEADSAALFRLRLRYKQPDADTSTLLEQDVRDNQQGFDDGSADFQWAAAVASFGMMLRQSKHMQDTNWAAILEIAKGAKGADKEGYRAEFIELAQRARGFAER